MTSQLFKKIIRIHLHAPILLVAAVVVTSVTGLSFFTPGHAKAQDAKFENIPAPDEKGPYNVGIRTFDNVPMSAGRQTRIQIFYPAEGQLNSNSDCPNTYTISVFGGSYQRSSPLCAVQGATVATGPFPLVVFDHGGDVAGTERHRIEHLAVQETLASHGFIVLEAPHSGNLVAQIRDLSLEIDYMLGRNKTPGDPLFERIDPDRIGISGTSAGGRNSLRLAGGWANPGPGIPAIPADPRIKAMVLYEAGQLTAEVLTDAGNVTVPYLTMGGNRNRNGLANPILLDATMLATPRIHVMTPEALHFAHYTDICPLIEETREAALKADPKLPEPLTNLITSMDPNNPNSCLKIPGTDTCRRVCNTNINIDPEITDLKLRANISAAAREACLFWNRGDIGLASYPSDVNAGGGRNFCPRIGVNPLSTRPLDDDGDGFTDSPPFLANVDSPFISNDAGTPMPGEVLVPLVKLYTVAFWKKFLADDGRYMRYLTPGYANTQNLEAEVTIIGEEE